MRYDKIGVIRLEAHSTVSDTMFGRLFNLLYVGKTDKLK